jgi:hypothetical protein
MNLIGPIWSSTWCRSLARGARGPGRNAIKKDQVNVSTS